MKHTIEELFKKAPELKELDKQMKKDPVAWEKDFWILARMNIIEGIQAGNFYNYEDADTLAEYFKVPKENWSLYGCPEFDFEN